MGIDYLPKINLSQLDFENNPDTATQPGLEDIVPPDQIPRQSLPLKTLPNEILKSSTVENLISQNDDLMARLKVALRRLAIIENDNLKVREEADKIKQRHETITDQLLIAKERENSWKQKVEHFEKQKEVAVEKATKLTAQNRSIRAELERYYKYHDRIKNQVKPYIAHLKDFAKVLEEKNQNLEREVNKRDDHVEQLRLQILEISDNAKKQISIQEQKVEDMVRYYEIHVESQSKELIQLRIEKDELAERAHQANRMAEKINTLENEIIQTRRSKDELKERLESENGRLKTKAQDLARTATTQELELKDLKQRVLEDEQLQREQERKIDELTQQLESLRYMWNAKNEEAEKLKTAIEALEKLNLSLSAKLNDWRQDDSEPESRSSS